MVHKNSNEPIGLSYVNVGLAYFEDGRCDAREYFFSKNLADDFRQATIAQMRAGGVRMVVMSHGINEPDRFPGAEGVDFMMRCLGSMIANADAHPRCKMIRTRGDMKNAEQKDQLGVVGHLTGCPINKSLQILEAYAILGIRSCHMFHNDPAFGGDWKMSGKGAGLTQFGNEALREMERLNILVDTAHANDAAFEDMIRLASKPLLDSHAGCRSIVNNKRNRTDAHIRAIACNGGVIGVHFASHLLTDLEKDPQREANLKLIAKLKKQFDRKYKKPYAYLANRYNPYHWPKALGGAVDDGTVIRRARLSEMIDHIERMVELAGIDHVCIGSDYALGSICAGVETAVKLPNLVAALKDRGYSKPERSKLLYGNLRRLLSASLPK